MKYFVLFVQLMCMAIIYDVHIMVKRQKAREIEYERAKREKHRVQIDEY